ncbi:hypothetical protein SUGI_0584610 [Cryptomeria japonica]|nr:hypothetical protein SUGI_0584610 [Cryptomeria japonica]
MDFYKVLDQTVREIKREVNIKVLKVPEIEQKVLDATSDEPWGPHGTVMAEIAQATKNFNESQLVMGALWKRVSETSRNWRHVYKALTVLEYLVANGSERVVDELLEHTFQISTLSDFEFVEPNGKDQGINVRKKAQNILSLINDKDKIREVRQKAAANRDKYGGLSSSGGYKPSSYSGFGGGYNGDRYDDDCYGSRNGGKSDDSPRQRKDVNANKYKDRDLNGQDGGALHSKSTDKYEDDDFARIRDHEDDRFGPKKEYYDEDNSFSRAQGTRRVGAAKASNSGQSRPSKKVTQIGEIDSAKANDDFDDFDPRGSFKPVAATLVPDFTDDLFGPPSAGTHSDVMKAVLPPPPSAVSPSIGARAPVNGLKPGTDLFADASFNTTVLDPPASATNSLNKSPLDALFPSSEDFFAPQTSSTISATSSTFGIDEEFGMFEAAPSKSGTAKSVYDKADPLDENLFSAFGTPEASKSPNMLKSQGQPSLTGVTQVQPIVAQQSNTAVAVKSQQQNEKFEPKSSIWADTLSRGLIDLNISAPRSHSLADIGIHLDSITSSERREEEKKTPTFSMGKAMGSGSGLGRAGASTMATPASSMMGPYGMGVMMGPGMGLTPGTNAPEIGIGNPMTIPSNSGTGYASNFTMGTGQGGLVSQQRQFGGFR